MSKSNKKRVAVNNQHHFVDEKLRVKYQSLLEDFLYLQKETVAKRRKLRAAKQKRANLFDEVRFVRQRHKDLMERQSGDDQPQDLVVQNDLAEDNLEVDPMKKTEMSLIEEKAVPNGENFTARSTSFKQLAV